MYNNTEIPPRTDPAAYSAGLPPLRSRTMNEVPPL